MSVAVVDVKIAIYSFICSHIKLTHYLFYPSSLLIIAVKLLEILAGYCRYLYLKVRLTDGLLNWFALISSCCQYLNWCRPLAFRELVDEFVHDTPLVS